MVHDKSYIFRIFILCLATVVVIVAVVVFAVYNKDRPNSTHLYFQFIFNYKEILKFLRDTFNFWLVIFYFSN